MTTNLFPSRPDSNPTIYAYKILKTKDREGLLKVGFTNRNAQERVHEQIGTTGLSYEIVMEESAMKNDGSAFTDHDVHRYLKLMNIPNPDGEWFECDLKDVKAAVLAIRNGEANVEHRTLDFKMRPEQEDAIEKTMQYFNSFKNENPDKTPHFLWNAKMRYGKTFATYQLAKKMGWKKVFVLTFKPAVQSAWDEDLKSHLDFEGWQFISRNGMSFDEIDKNKPYVCFGSFQDYLGKNLPRVG